MKKGFILPITLILMTLLLGMSITLSELASRKTSALKKQEENYYSGKKIVINLTEAIEDLTPFSDVIAINSASGGIRFKNSSYTKNSVDGKLVTNNPIIKENWKVNNTCKDIGGDKNIDQDCEIDESRGVEEYLIELPKKQEYNVIQANLKSFYLNNGSLLRDKSNRPIIELYPGNYYIDFNSFYKKTKKIILKGSTSKDFNIERLLVGSNISEYVIEKGNYYIQEAYFDSGKGQDVLFEAGSNVYIRKRNSGAALNTGSKGDFIFEKGYYEIEDITVDSNKSKILFEEGSTLKSKKISIGSSSEAAFESGEYIIETLNASSNTDVELSGNIDIITLNLSSNSELELGEGNHSIGELLMSSGSEAEIEPNGGRVIIDNLELGSGSIITLGDGEYWIDSIKLNSSNSQVKLKDYGGRKAKAVLYTSKIELESGTHINKDGEAKDLMIYNYGTSSNSGNRLSGRNWDTASNLGNLEYDIKLRNSNASITGHIYTEGVVIIQGSQVYGSVIGGEVLLEDSGAFIEYKE